MTCQSKSVSTCSLSSTKSATLSTTSSQVVELDATTEEEQVAEVFVRINSEGVTLNQADFILTLMSVFWEKARRAARGVRSRG